MGDFGGIRYSWQQALLDAFLASREELMLKVAVAQRAINARMLGELDVDERVALEDALRALRVLIAEFADGKSKLDEDKKDDIA